MSGLIACAATQWHRSGATAADLVRDKQECTTLSGNTSGVSNLATSRYVAGCLLERGWTEGPPPAGSAIPQAVADEPGTARPMPFDQCFERCRELTDRTSEQCFDACVVVGER